MLRAEGKVAYIAHEVTTLAREPALTSEQTVYRAGFKGMRTEYTEPSVLKGEIRADDGKVLAHLIPNQKLLVVRPSRIAGMREWAEHSARALEQGEIEIELVGKDKIAGRSAYVLSVKPRHHHHGARKFWVDADKWIKLRTEDIAPGGTVASMSYYTKIEFVNSIPDEKFKLEPPEGYRVEREAGSPHNMPLEKAKQLAGFHVLEPSYLPPGFKIAGASVVPFRGGKIIGIRYTDGVNTLSLFQARGETLNPRFLKRLHEGPVQPRRGVYSWRKGDLNFTIISRISMDDIRRVAGSVK
jgi:negative regulator of sigma E activity